MDDRNRVHQRDGLVQATTTIPGIQRCRTFDTSPQTEGQDPKEGFPQAITFILRYLATVDSLNLSGPFDEWYSQSATYQNADGKVYTGGETIWLWLRELFGGYGQIRHTFNSFTVLEYERDGNGHSHGEEHDDLVMLDTETRFWLEGELAGEGIKVPRMLSFRIHTRGLGGAKYEQHIVEAKAWWDTSLLRDRMASRQQMLP